MMSKMCESINGLKKRMEESENEEKYREDRRREENQRRVEERRSLYVLLTNKPGRASNYLE